MPSRPAFDQRLHEPVPARLLAAAGATDGGATGGNVVPLIARRFRLNRPTIVAMAASVAALAIGFGAGYWQAAPGGGLRLAAGPGTDRRQPVSGGPLSGLEDSSPGVEISYVDAAGWAAGCRHVVGPIRGRRRRKLP